MAIASGTVGTCSWEISNSGVLTIGAGNINIYAGSMSAWPWNNYRDQVTSINFSGTVTFSRSTLSSTVSCAYMFSYMENLTSISNLTKLNTTGVNTMRGMFETCESLTSINVSGFNTSSVTSMVRVFGGCKSLTSLDLSSWDTSNVTSMLSMFNGCSSLTSLNLTGFDVSNVQYFGYMFNGCENLASLDVSSFATSSATSMVMMFRNCLKIPSLDLSLFDTSNVSEISLMFENCPMLTSVTIGANFDLSSRSTDGIYFVVYGKTAENTTNGIIITSDTAFCSLTTAERQGVWDRACDATFSATAARTSGGSADEDGEDVTFSVNYVTESTSQTRTLNIYQKAALSPSYPSTAVYTASLSGDSGTATPTISNIGDGAYDFKVVFYDGENYFTAYPSVQSNIRLFTLDTNGNVEVLGEVTATDANDVAHNLTEKVSKSGDTMTGDLFLKSSNIDRDGADPTSNTTGNAIIRFYDKDDEYIGSVYSYRYTDGRQRVSIQAVNEKSDASQATNALSVIVAKDGTQTYAVSNQAGFRSAIGLGTDKAWTAGLSNIAWYMKRGRFVTVAAYGNGDVQKKVSSSWTTLFTLPSGYRPQTHEVRGYCTNYGSSADVIYQIATDGKVQVYSTASNDPYWCFHITFPVA